MRNRTTELVIILCGLISASNITQFISFTTRLKIPNNTESMPPKTSQLTCSSSVWV